MIALKVQKRQNDMYNGRRDPMKVNIRICRIEKYLSLNEVRAQNINGESNKIRYYVTLLFESTAGWWFQIV